MELGIIRWILVEICLQMVSASCIYDPGLPTDTYVKLGDINLGTILPISNVDKVKPCGEGLRATSMLQIIEAFVFAVDQINARDDILPNITLGYVILDGCTKDATVLTQGLSFLPRSDYSGSCFGVSGRKVMKRYDVIGVIAAMKSSSSMALARLFGIQKVPQISFASTSDELSDKELYPYFLRVIPPDKFQVQAMMKLIQYYKWSYISVIYTEGSYGETAFKNIKLFTDKYRICIAMDQKVSITASQHEYDIIVNKLIQNDKARVVILFTSSINALAIMKAIERKGSQKRFIWLGSEAWGLRIQNFGDSWKTALGAFTMRVYTRKAEDFISYFKSLTPNSKSENPWYQAFWEDHFSCEIIAHNDSCSSRNLSQSDKFDALTITGSVIDAVNAFAIGAHNAVKTTCSGVSKQNLSYCLTGDTLLQSIQNMSFTGNVGEIIFNQNGDVLGTYLIDQLQQVGNTYSQVGVAAWNAATSEISVTDDLVSWAYVDKHNLQDIPESVCSKPCLNGEFLIQKELSCCWECRKCRDTERVILNGTDCAACPKNHWPETKTNFTTCTVIPFTSVTLWDPIPTLLFGLALLGICSSLAVLLFFIKHRRSRHIKAASRELSFLMLLGIIFAYFFTLLSLFSQASTELCVINYIGFCLGFSWIYAPLLVKTNRIYRIFEKGKKSKQRPPMISPKSQIAIASTVIFVQV